MISYITSSPIHPDRSSQFGFDGGDIWKTRRDSLFATLHSNPKAPYVIRAVQFGSEPLFDSVLPHQELTKQVLQAKNQLSSLKIQVTVSEMVYGYQKPPGALDVLNATDFVDLHMLPFFSTRASTGENIQPPCMLICIADTMQRINHGP